MNRRRFLQHMAGALAAGALARPLWWPVAARGSLAAANGRILVLVDFQGGNDGLNTVVPFADDLYYAWRPGIGIPKNQVLSLDGASGLHPSLAPLMPLWDAGRVGIVQGVGYPDMNLSHFRGTDIIFSGSSSDVVWGTGWIARWLARITPGFPTALPADPLALQQGFADQLPLSAEAGTTGVVVDDPETFFQIVNETYPGAFDEGLDGYPADEELAYVRGVDVESFEYAGVIQQAAEDGSALGSYPSGAFGGQLATVARLIAGNLDTPVYLTAYNGFDTHATQPGRHDGLLADFAQGMAAFMEDMDRIGRSGDVLVMTVSEFGRRVGENGSSGTDHGTAAPWFLIGGGIQGGLHGAAPPLDILDPNENLVVQTDYRSVYATILTDWFGTDPFEVEAVLDGAFPTLPIVTGPAAPGGSVTGLRPGTARTRLFAPSPNPGRGPRRIAFELGEAARVTLGVFDVRGRRVARVAEESLPAGRYERQWNPEGRFASGLYFLVLEAGRDRRIQKVLVE